MYRISPKTPAPSKPVPDPKLAALGGDVYLVLEKLKTPETVNLLDRIELPPIENVFLDNLFPGVIPSSSNLP